MITSNLTNLILNHPVHPDKSSPRPILKDPVPGTTGYPGTERPGIAVQPQLTQTIQVWFDGGCVPNPGNKYGSFEVGLNNRTSVYTESRVELGYGTNNEAEFETLILALSRTLEHLELGALSPSLFTVQLFTDSTIIRNRLTGKNMKNKKEYEKRMFTLTQEVLELLAPFKHWDITWNSRVNNVARFGH